MTTHNSQYSAEPPMVFDNKQESSLVPTQATTSPWPVNIKERSANLGNVTMKDRAMPGIMALQRPR